MATHQAIVVHIFSAYAQNCFLASAETNVQFSDHDFLKQRDIFYESRHTIFCFDHFRCACAEVAVFLLRV